MKNLIFSIYDVKSNLWSEPIVAVNEKCFKRFVYSKYYNENLKFGKDLQAYCIGQFYIEGYRFQDVDFEDEHEKAKFAVKGLGVGDLANPFENYMAIESLGTVYDICNDIMNELKSGSVEPEEADA